MHIFNKATSRSCGKERLITRAYLFFIGFILLSVLFVFARCRSIALKKTSPLGDLVYCNTMFFPSGLGWLEDDSSKHFILLYTFTPRYVDGCFLRFDVSVSPAGKVVQELFPYPDIEMSSEQRYNDARKLLEQGAIEQRHSVEDGEIDDAAH